MAGNFVRFNITITSDLKGRMDAVKGVNWSEVARNAFEEKISEAQFMEGVSKNMKETVERLRESKRKHREAQAEAGRIAGADWAKKSASYEQLERLSMWHEFQEDDDGYTPEHVYRVMEPLCSDHEAIEFWTAFPVHGVSGLSTQFLLGFVESAVEVFSQVEDQL